MLYLDLAFTSHLSQSLLPPAVWMLEKKDTDQLLGWQIYNILKKKITPQLGFTAVTSFNSTLKILTVRPSSLVYMGDKWWFFFTVKAAYPHIVHKVFVLVHWLVV